MAALQDLENKVMGIIDDATELSHDEWELFVQTVRDYLEEKDDERT